MNVIPERIRDILTPEVRSIIEGHLAGQEMTKFNYHVMTGAVDVAFTGGGFVLEEMTVMPCQVAGCKAQVTNYQAVREESND